MGRFFIGLGEVLINVPKKMPKFQDILRAAYYFSFIGWFAWQVVGSENFRAINHRGVTASWPARSLL